MGEAKSLWERKRWREEADAWIRDRLGEIDVQTNGEFEQFHIREWSTVIRIPTEIGNVYFKAGAESQQFEARLLKFLNEKIGDSTLPILAIEAEKGWALMPDGGRTLRQMQDEKVDQRAWEQMLRELARIQIKLVAESEELLKSGLPDKRLEALVSAFPDLLAAKAFMAIGEDEGLSSAEYEELLGMQTQFSEMCGELAAFGIPASIDHGDLHDANVFFNEGKFIFFDWGDASLTHPFISLMIPLRVLGNRLGVKPENHAELEWARRAYLREWISFLPMVDLQKAWDLALHIARFHRSLTWLEVAKSLKNIEQSRYRSFFPSWLREFIYHPEMPPE